MGLVKCPRCELNYIQEGEGFCKICKREMKGESHHDEIEMCTVCNEAPALPGKDVCLFCLKEMNANARNNEDENEGRVSESNLEIDPVSAMDEIIPEIDEDIPERSPNSSRYSRSRAEIGRAGVHRHRKESVKGSVPGL